MYVESLWDLLPPEIKEQIEEQCYIVGEYPQFGPDVKVWKQKGKIHRDNDLPAVINNDGTKRWYRNGALHRDNDMPAVIHGGSKFWYRDNMTHREEINLLLYYLTEQKNDGNMVTASGENRLENTGSNVVR